MLRGLRNKAGFLLAVVFAAAAGGLATGVVMAAIPDSGGAITAVTVRAMAHCEL